MNSNTVKTTKRVKTKNRKSLGPEWGRTQDFFMILGEDGPSDELWKMLKLALIVDNDHSNELERSNMIFLYENAKVLFEDVFSLLQQQKKKMALE
ncbi:hypothetical protein [Ferruginibacter sp.]|nr:hypothetical protein [Ferruginibacter sp.]